MTKRVLQDFSLIQRSVEKAKRDFALAEDSSGFYFVLLPLILDLQDDEVDDAITDNFYQGVKKRPTGKDRGIDAIYIETGGETSTVHFFCCKYVSKFEKTEGFTESNQIDKIESFLTALMSQDAELQNDVNQALAAKVSEIWDEQKNRTPSYVVHICSNKTDGFEPTERARFEKVLATYSKFKTEFHIQSTLAARLAHGERMSINGQIKAIDTHLFEIVGGDVRALILHVDAVGLLRLLSDSEHLRSNPNHSDTEELRGGTLCEDAFEDNIRLYLQQRSKVNRNIKATILGEDDDDGQRNDQSHYFFYFNNGITITCDRFSYPKKQRAPIVDVENIQVVNGGQTLHALSEAFKEQPEKLEGVELLCRLYETKNKELSSRIAECTNSQNPVKSRDIRSIDMTQVKLEKEFKKLGLFYERKKNQFSAENKANRIDAEKCGQVMLAFYEGMPQEAKNKKALIFGEKFDDLFSEDTTAHKLLLPFRLFETIEAARSIGANRRAIWIRYATYHILYAMRLLADDKKIELGFENLEKIQKLYPKARKIVHSARKNERAAAARERREYADVLFFKSKSAKTHIDSLIKG
jgi:hypothetical protein